MKAAVHRDLPQPIIAATTGTIDSMISASEAGITLIPVEQYSVPFRYILAERCIAPTLERALLDWLETDAPWRLVETDFYEQYEFSMLDSRLPVAVAPLADRHGLETV